MQIKFHRKFRKKFKKLRQSEKDKFAERLELFEKNIFYPLLNNHPLHGEYAGYRSIDITGDLRAHYEQVNNDTVLFITIGTHPELYGK